MVQTKQFSSTATGVTDVNNVIRNSPQEMEKGLKIWHAVLTTIGTIIIIGSILVNQSNKIETQRLRIEFLETDARDKGLQIKDLNQATAQEYKEINGKLTDILISLQNKENKK